VNIKSVFAEALGQALDLGIGTPDDVLKHVTPDLLAQSLPRPLWARLLTACLGAPRVDAQLVVETIGVHNLCEHVPTNVIWAVLSQIAARVLAGSEAKDYVAPQPAAVPVAITTANKSAPTVTTVEKRSVLAPPPDAIATPVAATKSGPVGPAIPSPVNEPLADLITELEQDDRPITPTRSRTPTAQRFRQSNTGIGGRLGGASATQPRRPQAQAVPPTPAAKIASARRGSTEVEEVDTDASDWKREIPVDDSQLVDWQSTETTQTAGDEDFSDIGRKR
jgi:hypothetical protein